MPSIEGGGVEKNLFLITNFLSTKFKKIKIITSSNNTQKFNKNIKITNIKLLNSIAINRFLKVIISSIYLIIELIKHKNVIVLSFQSNLFSTLIAKIFSKKIIIGLNSSPSGWLNNYFKKIIFRTVYSLADLVLVNSLEFKRELLSKINVKSFCIYNPLNKKDILKNSKKKIKNNPFKKKKKKKKKKDTLKIINIGRLVDQKNQITLLKSINYLKNFIKIEALIIGQGKNEFALKNYINDNSLNKIVKILNYQKKSLSLYKAL